MDQVDPYRVLQVAPTAEQEVIQAAYRALALKYHPDRDASEQAQRRMLLLNAAYALVRDELARAAWDRSRAAGSAAPGSGRWSAGRTGGANAVPPPARADSAGTRIDFGRYAGWTLRDLARRDPDYLRWLSRHSSGIAYRTEIYQILGRRGATAA
jgi:DnaJ-class molecular chaperone